MDKNQEEKQMEAKKNINITHIFGPLIYQMQMNTIQERQGRGDSKENEKALFEVIDDYIEQA